MKTEFFRKNRFVWLTAAISLLSALAVFLPAIIADKGFFLIVDDFNSQQLTFATAVRCALRARPLGEWFWGIDLGTSLVNTFGFYNLGSPFYWLSFLFPNVPFPYLAGWLFVLKYVVAAVTAHLYLKRFLKDERYAIIGALLYAFSGFQSTNLMFFHFHDVVAFFPLLLLGLEQVMEDRSRRGVFILAVFLNCLVNYFFFVGEVVFLLLYFLVRFSGRPWKTFWRGALGRLFDGTIGVGMAAILFVPSILYVFGSARSEAAMFSEDPFFTFHGIQLMLKGLVFPGDLMNDGSAISTFNYSSTAAFLPAFGLSFVFTYLLREKGRLRILLGILFVVCMFPILQSAFYLFADVYQRWWYMLVLMTALATVLVLDRSDESRKREGLGVLLNGALAAGVYLLIRFFCRNGEGEALVFHPERLLIQAAIAIVPPFLVWLLRRMRRQTVYAVVALTAAVCCATSAMTLYQYRSRNTNTVFRQNFEAGLQMEAIDDQYRYRANGILMTMTGEPAAYIGFCSTLENSSYAFNRLFDIDTVNMTRDRSKVEGLPELLGAKFRPTGNASEKEEKVEYLTVNGVKYYMVTYEDTCPIGFALDAYQTETDLYALPIDERACALMHAFLIAPEEIDRVSDLAEPFDADALDLSNELSNAVARCRQNAVSAFERDNTGFRCQTNYDRARFVYFTVPFDRGWHAEIDGAPAEILNSGGMMLLRVPQGEHAVSFVYRTPGLRLGAAISAAFAAALAVVWILAARRKKRS